MVSSVTCDMFTCINLDHKNTLTITSVYHHHITGDKLGPSSHCIHCRLILTEAKSGYFCINSLCSLELHHRRKASSSFAIQCRPQSKPSLISSLGLAPHPGRLRLFMQFSPHDKQIISSDFSLVKSVRTLTFSSLEYDGFHFQRKQ